MSDEKIITIRVALKGRPVGSYRFGKDVITVGRDPASDIVLDNAGVSRAHMRFVRTSGGYFSAEDLGSANGTFLNQQRIQTEYIMHNDVVQIGKYGLWVSYEAGQRGQTGTPASRGASPGMFEGTTVLSTTELEHMMARPAEAETAPSLRLVDKSVPEPAPAAATEADPESAPMLRPGVSPVVWVVLLGMIVGLSIGAAIMWLLLR